MHIRLASPEDAPAIRAIYAPFIEDSFVSFETVVPSVAEMAARIAAVLAEAPWLVCTAGDEVAGYAYAGSHRARQAYQWNRELSVYLAEKWQGKGIARALYTTLIDLIRLQGYANALAGIALPNEASVRFHERLGFRPVGVYHHIGFKNGQFCDVGWWEMPIRETPPGRIFSIADLENSEEWREVLLRGAQAT